MELCTFTESGCLFKELHTVWVRESWWNSPIWQSINKKLWCVILLDH